MKKLIILIPALFFCFFINAQQITDKKAKDILDEVSEKMKSYKTMSIDFTYTMENKANKINQSKKGNILIKGDKYCLSMDGQTVIFDENAIYTYIPDANEVQINDPTKESILPSQFLNEYNKNYKSNFIREETSAGNIYQIIDLTPVKQSNSIAKVRLKINKSKKQIASSILYDKDGTTYTYSIDKFITDYTIPDSKFIFKKSDFPNAEIIDMR